MSTPRAEMIETINRRHTMSWAREHIMGQYDYYDENAICLKQIRDNEDTDAPIMNTQFPYEFGYESGLSVQFCRWMVEQGWWYECDDYGTYLLYEIDDETAERMLENNY